MLLSTFAELSLSDQYGRILLYASIAAFLIIAVIAILTKKFRPEKLNDLFKYIIGIAIGYAAAIIIGMAFIKFRTMVTEGSFVKELFYPILCSIITIFTVITVGLVLSFLAPRALKIYKYVAYSLLAVAVTVTIIFISLYYKNYVKPDEYYTDVSDLGLALSSIGLFAVLSLIPLIFGKKSVSKKTKSIVYGAILIALSFALSYIRIFKLPQGGSITLVSILPIMLYSKIFGTRKGVLVGVVYGILQAIQDPWIIHPAQFLLDYPLAFGMIGLSGIFYERKIISRFPVLNFVFGGILAVILRYVCHALSGIYAFSVYAPEQFNAVAWGFLYNAFACVDGAIAIVVGAILLSSKTFNKALEKINE